MNPSDDKKQHYLRLRAEAEQHIDDTQHVRDPLAAETPMPALDDLLHELQVHQVELEMQNEALRQTQSALEASRDRYVDLYEFAPVGYLTLSTEGLIEEINLSATLLLGKERKELLHRGFRTLVAAKDQDRWLRHFLSMKEDRGHCTIELTMQRGDGALLEARLDCLRAPGEARRVRVALSDVGERKRSEELLEQSRAEIRKLHEFGQQQREEDRRLIARELHDDLGHRLTAISMDIERLEAKLLPTEAKAGLPAILGQVYQVVDAVRRISEDLRPGMLDALGLPAAVESHVNSFAARTGITCELAMSHDDFPVDGNIAINIFRIVQEALNNAMKYAKASKVVVTLQFSAQEISLMVEDDGIGLAEQGKDGRIGFGLLGMRERVTSLNGQLSIASEPGHGVRIEVVIPTPG